MPPQSRSKRAPPASPARRGAKLDTRDALIQAGMELFAEQGLDLPSLDALCARAGFTRGAFYVHFADREAFIVAVMESATSHFVEALLSARGHAAGLGEVVTAFAASIAGGSFPVFGAVPLHQFLAACSRSTALRERYLEILLEVRHRLAAAARADQASGAVRDDVDPELTAGLLLALALGVGTLTELHVPFVPPAHAGALLDLLTAPRRR